MLPADRGTLMHAVLDQFFEWLQANGGSPAPGTPWTPAQREQLHMVESLVADEFEERGATGHPTMWRRDRTILFDDLDKLLDKDEEVRAGRGSPPGPQRAPLRSPRPPAGGADPDRRPCPAHGRQRRPGRRRRRRLPGRGGLQVRQRLGLQGPQRGRPGPLRKQAAAAGLRDARRARRWRSPRPRSEASTGSSAARTVAIGSASRSPRLFRTGTHTC